MFTELLGFLGISQKPEPSPQEKEEMRHFHIGVESVLQGRNRYQAEDWEGAFTWFDDAVARGFVGDGVYEKRAMCLQCLGFALDAIDDFDKAIEESPDDCNLYFMRGLSMQYAVRYVEADEDFNRAICLSKVKSGRNARYNEAARGMGRESAAALYELHKSMNSVYLEGDQLVEEMLKERRTPTLRRSPRPKAFKSALRA